MKKESLKNKGNSVESLPNIGKVMAGKLGAVGIHSKDEFLRQDPYEIFNKLRKKVDPTLCRCALASIVGAKKGIPWHKVTKESAKEYEKRHPKHIWGKC